MRVVVRENTRKENRPGRAGGARSGTGPDSVGRTEESGGRPESSAKSKMRATGRKNQTGRGGPRINPSRESPGNNAEKQPIGKSSNPSEACGKKKGTGWMYSKTRNSELGLDARRRDQIKKETPANTIPKS